MTAVPGPDDECQCGHIMREHVVWEFGMLGCSTDGCLCVDFCPDDGYPRVLLG